MHRGSTRERNPDARGEDEDEEDVDDEEDALNGTAGDVSDRFSIAGL